MKKKNHHGSILLKKLALGFTAQFTRKKKSSHSVSKKCFLYFYLEPRKCAEVCAVFNINIGAGTPRGTVGVLCRSRCDRGRSHRCCCVFRGSRSLQMCALAVENYSERNPRAGAAFHWWLSRSYERRDGVNRNKVSNWGPRTRPPPHY